VRYTTVEIEKLVREIERLRKQNEELKLALFEALDSKANSLLRLCPSTAESKDETEE
jgi:cell division septum initiation protein DivIVA